MLATIAGYLDEVLYNVLLEWVVLEDTQKQKIVAQILFMFNDGQAFYDLSREIIIRTDEESTLSAISGAITSTPLLSTPMDSSTQFHRKRIEDLSPGFRITTSGSDILQKEKYNIFKKCLNLMRT